MFFFFTFALLQFVYNKTGSFHLLSSLFVYKTQIRCLSKLLDYHTRKKKRNYSIVNCLIFVNVEMPFLFYKVVQTAGALEKFTDGCVKTELFLVRLK
jgi:hypothetical protein